MQQESKVHLSRNIFSKVIKHFKAYASYAEIALILLLLIIHICVIKLYRPYVYANFEIKEGLSFVNNYPSFSSVLLGYLVFKIYYSGDSKALGIFGFRWKYFLLVGILLGNYLFEGLDMMLGKGDWYDMIAITLGGIFVFPFVYFKNSR